MQGVMLTLHATVRTDKGSGLAGTYTVEHLEQTAFVHVP